MARTSTALTYIRVAKEDSFKISNASPTWFYPWAESCVITPARDPLTPRFLTADRFIRAPVAGEHKADGRVSCTVGPENFHKFLLWMWPSLSSSAIGVAEGYLHTFSGGNTQHTFELQAQKGWMEEWNRGGWIRSCDFSSDRNSILRADLDVQFAQQDVVTVYSMPTNQTYSTLDPFTDCLGTLERDDGAVTDMDGFSLRVSMGPQDFKSFGSISATDVVPGKYEIGWDLNCAFASDTEFRRFLGSKASTFHKAVGDRFETLKLEWKFQTGQYIDAGLAEAYRMILTCFTGSYETFENGIPSDNELLRSRPVLRVHYSASDSKDLQIDLANTVAPATVAL